MSKRNKTLNSFFQVRTTEAAETGPSAQTTDVESAPNVRAELKPGDVESDPGKRIPIEELDPDIRDLARREYISMGPCQPSNHTYEKINGRSFHNYWFNDHRGWLEYSIEKRSAFCFYCFLFKQPRAENYGIEAFTRNGFKSWKDGPKVFNQHVGKHDSAHNKSRQHYEDFKNQRQNLPHVFDRGSQKQEEEYKACLLIILGIVKFLIQQALAFRGHDESTSSMNKGNFKELLDLFIKKDPKVAKLFGDAVATATVERAFSAMSIIKTGSRNKMGDDWMNHRMVCYIERDVFVSIEESKIIERFQGYRTRKGVLPRPTLLAMSALEDVVMGGSDQPII
uniref:TTF-type domain-containing protein n=1 Tax=Triticum urartu TaxID=4572 RepID=A0A8R7V029_TRIUA